ncbi:ribosome biogenesis protein SLX9-domain-containing protein [Endogone sp. FLAS-F59071]|nr:ribosome biogenesis protein SLX9-domain-containing protein [Endogone sp. FLAS-F59071]|eukprot:RUS20446.1 ribosome biogenesis protein SLX9-domain-containing protein [Endogone sp. FLAS-F59071]
MPKVKRSRTRLHGEPVTSAKSHVAQRAFAVQDNAVLERIETSDDQAKIVASKLTETDGDPTNVNKKLKRKIRHDTWMQSWYPFLHLPFYLYQSFNDTIATYLVLPLSPSIIIYSSELDQTYTALTKTKKPKKDQLSIDLSSFKDALASIESMTKSSRVKATRTIIGSETSPSQQAAQKVTSKKGRKNTAVKEILRFQKVLQHPAFKASPLATIQQHVKNTLETVQKS